MKNSTKLIFIVSAPLIFISGYLIFIQFLPKNEDALLDVFDVLENQGFTANVGFSGIYAPGNVIQTVEQGEDGQEQRLATPIVVLWRDQCFPNKHPRKSIFILPVRSGKSSASLGIRGDFLGQMLPSLIIDSAVVTDYSVRFENPHTVAYAKLEISQNLSKACVEVLKREIDVGAKAEWFSVVQQAVIADAISFEMRWKNESSLQARSDLKRNVRNTLTTFVAKHNDGQQLVPEINWELK